MSGIGPAYMGKAFEAALYETNDIVAKVYGLPVSMIAVGPSREQTIMRRWERRL
ncbi:MAG: hypothetical protein Q7V14_00465 [Coriobacteriia bacterium]|nr:hypothetical protein [Coriobacteriia bacterium]MDO9108724.1 hypothetical protein [Coriobacteriia bacterium]